MPCDGQVWRVYGRNAAAGNDSTDCPYDVNEHYLQLTLLVMFMCAAQQILITMMKTLVLAVTCTLYILVTTLQHVRAPSYRNPMSVFLSLL